MYMRIRKAREELGYTREQFAEKLDEFGFKYSKGSIQIPYSDNLPIDLISAIAAWCRDTGNHA